jgi:type 1 glutamine amidotransferase
MSQEEKRILMVLGGTYHDFNGFATAVSPLFQRAGYAVESTYDLNRLETLPVVEEAVAEEVVAGEADSEEAGPETEEEESGPDVVLLYTCLSGLKDGERTHDEVTPKQAAALARWVRAGGGLLAAHSATVMHGSNRTLRRLLGGSFISHPPQFAFNIMPLAHDHPINVGIESFTVHDEFYMQEYDSGLDIHMAAVDRGVCYPMVWSKQEGPGRVAYVGPGHGAETWFLPAYRQLMLQTLGWLCGG